jgi:hypothetical protein
MQALDSLGKYHISTASLLDGIPADEMNYYADLGTIAAYSRAVGTKEGGYEAKKIAQSMQTSGLGPRNSDCKTKKYLKVLLSKDIANYYIDRWMVEKDGSLTLLTKENMDKYINKYVNFRSPMFCNDKKKGCFCAKCCGEIFYKLDMYVPMDDGYSYGIGMIANRIGTVILNSALKKFHNTTIKLKNLSTSDFISKI